MVEIIQNNKARLSEIDGAAGDGDHRINMSKGSLLHKINLTPLWIWAKPSVISQVLPEEIGGSMGPLYGTGSILLAMNRPVMRSLMHLCWTPCSPLPLRNCRNLPQQRGDKTMLDAPVPATQALNAALAEGQGCVASLIKWSRVQKMDLTPPGRCIRVWGGPVVSVSAALVILMPGLAPACCCYVPLQIQRFHW